MFDNFPILLLLGEEEHVGEAGVNDGGVAVGHKDQVQALLPTVPAPPECQVCLVVPGWSCVGLD